MIICTYARNYKKYYSFFYYKSYCCYYKNEWTFLSPTRVGTFAFPRRQAGPRRVGLRGTRGLHANRYLCTSKKKLQDKKKYDKSYLPNCRHHHKIPIGYRGLISTLPCKLLLIVVYRDPDLASGKRNEAHTIEVYAFFLPHKRL